MIVGQSDSEQKLVGKAQIGGDEPLPARPAGIALEDQRPLDDPAGVVAVCDGKSLVVIGVGEKTDAGLFQVGGALDGAASFPRLIQCRKQHRGEDGDDCNHN